MFVDSECEISLLSNEQKLFLLEIYWKSLFGEPFLEMTYTTGFKYPKSDNGIYQNILSNLKSGNIKDVVEKINSDEFISVQLYKCSVINACFIEIIKMITLGITARKCHNCGRYYVVTGRSDTEYCDRIAPGYADKTCKDIGPIKEYAKRLENNPLLLAYQKAYKAKHAELRKITNPTRYEEEREKLKQWRLSAKASAEKGEVIEEFKKWLK